MINKFATIFLLALTTLVYGQNEDALLWTSASLEGKISKDFNFELNTQFRFDDNMSRIGSSMLQGSIDYELGKFIKITGGYRLSNNRENYNYSVKHRLYADLDFDYKLIKKLDFEFRLRTQYGFDRLKALNEYIPSTGKTIMRFKYGFQYKIKDWKPSMSNELFFNTAEKLISAYRLNIGSSYKISKRHSMKIEYTFQKEIGGTSAIEHIYQLGYSYNLKGKLFDNK